MLSLIAVSLISVVAQGPKAAQVIDIGIVPGYENMVPTAISDKGDVAVGWASKFDNRKKYHAIGWIWTERNGLVTVDKMGQVSHIWAVSPDGNYYAGSMHRPPKGPWVFYGLTSNPNGAQGTIGQGLSSTGGYSWQQGLRYSGDGEHIIGISTTVYGGRLQIYNFKTKSSTIITRAAEANMIGGISRDGSRVLVTGVQKGFLWDERRPFEIKKLRVKGSVYMPEYTTLSDDGKWVGGMGWFANGSSAFLWSETEGLKLVPPTPTRGPFHVHALNADASVVAGKCTSPNDGFWQPSIWTKNMSYPRTLKSLILPSELPDPKLWFETLSDVNPEGNAFLVTGFLFRKSGEGYPPRRAYIIRFPSKNDLEARVR